MTPETPIVSVLMPAKNAASTIPRSIQSVQSQSMQNWELIVIDDASSDQTSEIVTDLVQKDTRISLITLPNQVGAAAARNHGLSAAKGRFIAFLDADDLWLPQKLARQISFMEDNAAALAFTSYHRISEDERLIETVAVPNSVSYTDLLARNHIGCLTAVYDTRVYGKVPMPDITRQHDYALWLHLARSAGPIMGIEEPLAIYRVGRGSLSANKALAAQDMWRVYRNLENLPLTAATRRMASYAWFGLTHRLIQKPPLNATHLDELLNTSA